MCNDRCAIGERRGRIPLLRLFAVFAFLVRQWGFSRTAGLAPLARPRREVVTGNGNKAVYEILAADSYTTVKTLGGGFNRPSDVALDGSGNDFVSGSVVQWNGASVTTNYISPRQISATITASEYAAQPASITVNNPSGTCRGSSCKWAPPKGLPGQVLLAKQKETLASDASRGTREEVLTAKHRRTVPHFPIRSVSRLSPAGEAIR